jgi:hypothetical protein
MYRLGEREQHHRKLYMLLGVFAVILVVGIFFAKQLFTSDAKINNPSAAVVTNVSYDQKQVQQVDTPYFSMKIPAAWKAGQPKDGVPQATYLWQGTTGEDKNRWISVYVDAALASFAVNRALHVQSNDSSISVIGNTSDNCTSYTGPANTATGKTPAKWETIDFLCDSGNYARDVVGTVSADGLNNINLSGKTKGVHKYFFTFTDNSNQPDYSIFREALKSFEAK